MAETPFRGTGSPGRVVADPPATEPEPGTDTPEVITVPELRAPADGVPAVVADDDTLALMSRRLAAGSGPIAVDAERASGHRYGQRAFLVQLRRDGFGTMLVDPITISDTSAWADAMSTGEWILHSATQDLSCLAELGLRPPMIFDTELAGRLLGLPRVGLAGLTEDLLGVSLAKGHGAADWSLRPLPESWLNYAALDVELLHELREDLTERLRRAGRTEWARQEFRYLLTWEPRVRVDPWRRTSGVSRISTLQGMAVVRALWQAREELAESWDRPPARVLHDRAIIAAARALPATREELLALPEYRNQRRSGSHWWAAVSEALELPAAELPPLVNHDGPPPPRTWDRRRPAAARRLSTVRAAIAATAEDLGIAAEVLVSPEPVRLWAWDSDGSEVTESAIRSDLASHDVRAWQLELVAPVMAAAIARTPTADTEVGPSADDPAVP